MSKEVAKQIVMRCKKDPEFLAALLSGAEEVLKDYDLTEIERKFFRDADKKTLENLHESCFEIADKRSKKSKH